MQDNSPTSEIAQAWPFDGAPKRLVVKIGSNVLSQNNGSLHRERLTLIANDIAAFRSKGTEIVIVTSGAVAAGMGEMKFEKRPGELSKLQGLAAIGQCQLMSTWREAFANHNIRVAQILLSRPDLDDRQRFLNAKNTLDALLQMGVIPIVNENDSVATDELTFGDNDMLSAIIATKVNAELLVILTDIDGLFTANPKTDSTAKMIPVVELITPEILALGSGVGSNVGRGGMATKIRAAKHANSFGVTTVMANGTRPEKLSHIADGNFQGTLFLTQERPKSGKARMRWVSMAKPAGQIIIDDGAKRALIEKNASLLSVGIRKITGNFITGDVVLIQDLENNTIARGVVSFSSDDLKKIMGKTCEEATNILGEGIKNSEAVHKNNLYLIP